MKSLTWGDFPPQEELDKAFDKHCHGGDFKVKAGMSPVFASLEGSGLDCPPYLTRVYTKKEFMRILRELTAIWNDEDDQMAGQEASTMMQMLGYEWI